MSDSDHLLEDVMASTEQLRARILELEAEIVRRDSYAGCDGCSTGDCPHSSMTECVAASAKVIAEQEARIDALEKENVDLVGYRDACVRYRNIMARFEEAAETCEIDKIGSLIRRGRSWTSLESES